MNRSLSPDLEGLPYLDHGIITCRDITGRAYARLERRSYRHSSLTLEIQRELARQGWCYQTRWINRKTAYDIYVRQINLGQGANG